ncbi:hypothetical protein XENTR_v10000010 [Xenopus tropicalis]|uniref:Lipid droplet-regulating VLDL assembly factor AUP1 n=1 Tax=Xenopus tropicalis TaxID=8364 RepID=B7ZTU4_XENTR|nr:ancient ubiquitous protein 1 isoform X1 [Xenopus tropicalis]XP_031747617.1 ancient ubiquitous protein 1 isoform X1 [Xenopus tropicalis]AAI70997.1 Ancient ubiquitous protein 1 [Xenopus tropicalis]AAI70999.1 Ancient ubiquitous protein 1 [Xenopus tropicalis]KAE8628434.1 hypothetical protein XENTR_v10000010 [Xenopus tropicalis]|eukprot:XP_012810972.1 PREDICTED: ancient ubiquitous protein 1 [Xenopus tropicalis]
MEQPSVESLLELRRFPRKQLSLILLLLYSPLGLCLFLIRLFIGAHVFLVSCVLPDSVFRRFLLRVMSSVLGVYVSHSALRPLERRGKILICNHRTDFDHNIISLIAPCCSPSLSCAPGFLCWARGFLELGALGSRTQLMESLKHYLSQPGGGPLLLFPEEETTSGRTGLLHFSSWPFSLSDSVQPLTLTVQRPLIAAAVSGCSWVTELFWLLFIPFTVYQVRWLPPVTRHTRESDEEFAFRVQQMMAGSLGVAATRHTGADRAEYLKRRRTELPRSAPRSVPLSPTQMQMAQHVKEVLPQVPLSAIHRDLGHTGCIDTTITNFLEGRVTFLPEEETLGGNEATERTPIDRISRPLPRGFAKSPEVRHLSLQERKEALYECARRKYLEKFGSVGREEEEKGARG